MFLKMWLLPLLIATSAIATPSPSPTPPQYSSPEPPRSGYYPSSSHRPVYTAQRDRDASPEDDEPYPATSSLGTAQTTHGAEEQPENTGFVEPIDFKNLLRDVESSSKGLELGASSSNPLFASESKNSFAGFFGTNKDPFADFGGGGLATASSDRTSSKNRGEGEAGFVDPNVQFRSLFESSQTSNHGFKPEDFLGNQGDSYGAEPSKGSQTRTYPSFTYSGRKEDESPNKYRSNYRQVETQDDDYSNNDGNNNNYRGRDDDREDGPSYNDRGYYGGGGRGDDDSPQASPPSTGGGSRYNNQGPRYSPTTEETSHRPQSSPGRSGSSSGPKASESKNPKCKKVEKTVDYENNDDYNSFTEPEQDYDPSTYRGRYKRQSRQGRQSRGGGGGAKRPMTCYVCEDENGRYAEKCSYDSKANPNKGEYFHSSSSAYRDNGKGNNGNGGRRNSGKTDRHRRHPSSNSNRQQHASASATTSSTVEAPSNTNSDSNKKIVHDIEESEPKIIEKRQSNPDRYASNFGGNGRQRNDNNNEFDFGGSAEFGLPRGYIGNVNGGRIDGYEGPQERQPTSNNNREGGGNREGNDNDNFGFTGNNDNNNNNDDRGFGFENDRNFNDFNFGPQNDFNERGESSSPTSGGSRQGSGQGSGGADFDFSIPKEYDPDVQLQGSNNNRPNLDGSASSNTDTFPRDFEIGLDDYVKRYFPDTFSSHGGSGGGGGGDRQSSEATTGPSSSYSPSSFQPNSRPQSSHSPPSYRPSYRPGPPPPHRENSFNQFNNRPHSHSPQNNHHNNHRGSPDKEHTQPSYHFSPPPNFFNDGNGPAIENTENLNKLMDNFSGRSRDGCQKIKKGDMSCYVCRDARGMNKEECMYASNDPKNTRMAYHEVTEYSSNPPASILPLPRPESLEGGDSHQLGPLQAASSISQKTADPSSPPSSPSVSKSKPTSSDKKLNSPLEKSGSITKVESMIYSSKIHHEDKSPTVEYDFDY